MGWKFSPAEVTIDINGVSDACSKNEDINFVFDGFGVVGRVVSAGGSDGPAGVKVSLLGHGGEEVQSTTTGEGGTYVFTAVPGTDHRVRASHASWTFARAEGAVSMTGDNGQAEDLVVAGYDVRGRVISDSTAPMPGVSVLLYGAPSKAVSNLCPSNLPSASKIPGLTQLCHVTTDSEGSWLLPAVPSGSYTLRAFYRGEATELEVLPATAVLEVGQRSVVFPSFTVAGFSVRGEVVAKEGGQGLPGVTVSLAGAKTLTAVTDDRGRYSLVKVQSGKYTLTGKQDGLEFPSLPVTVSPASPSLPLLAPTHFRVSGQLDFSSTPHDTGRTVLLSPLSDPAASPLSVPTSRTGTFQTMLKPGHYSVMVQPSSSDLEAGVVFAPPHLAILVAEAPVEGIYFSPVRVSVSGSISCLGAEVCPDFSVTLKPEGFGQEVTQVAKEGAFSFANQLPGSYVVRVEESGLCWKNHMLSFSIESESVDSLEFQQTGYMMEVHSSHETQLVYSAKGDTGELDIPVGPSSHCLPSPGPYSLATSSCHTFLPGAESWSATSGVLRLRAASHLVTGRVTSVDKVPDLKLLVHSGGQTKTVTLGEPEQQDGLYYYRFGHQATPHDELAIEPVAARFLLSPPRLHLLVADDCQLDSVTFTATAGLFVTGAVSPPLSGVRIRLDSATMPAAMEVDTDAKGSYSLGPFPRDLKYKVTASRLGYVLSPVQGDATSFTAKKLASVVVRLAGEQGQPLEEVLISLSGGESNYRTNEQTGPNGSRSFLGLSPGEYFVKPVLKEFEFEPRSKLITVKEGAEEVVEVLGKRVAFSLFGAVTGLKGEPETGVVLEAVGQGDCKKYQEEASTGQDGRYRIRGLQPSCTYLLSLKSTKANVQVERTIPSAREITMEESDVTGVDLIAIRPKTNMDVSLLVKVKKADSVKNIKAKLFCGTGDSPVHMVKMDGQKFVIFPSIPLDNSECFITVDASATQASHRVKSGRVDFKADKPIEHHKVVTLLLLLRSSPTSRSSSRWSQLLVVETSARPAG